MRQQITPAPITLVPLATIVNVSRNDLKPYSFAIETREKTHYLVSVLGVHLSASS